MAKKVALVTGGTSGIGLETSVHLKKKGFIVYEMSRRAEGPKNIHHLRASFRPVSHTTSLENFMVKGEHHGFF